MSKIILNTFPFYSQPQDRYHINYFYFFFYHRYRYTKIILKRAKTSLTHSIALTRTFFGTSTYYSIHSVEFAHSNHPAPGRFSFSTIYQVPGIYGNLFWHHLDSMRPHVLWPVDTMPSHWTVRASALLYSVQWPHSSPSSTACIANNWAGEEFWFWSIRPTQYRAVFLCKTDRKENISSIVAIESTRISPNYVTYFMSNCSIIPNAVLYFSSAASLLPCRYNSLPSTRNRSMAAVFSVSFSCHDSFSYSLGLSIEMISVKFRKNYYQTSK